MCFSRGVTKIGQLTRIPLGYAGEGGVRKVVIDVSAWLATFVGAVIVVHVLRPDKYPYIPATTVEDGNLVWEVGPAEVSVPGKGWAQICAYNVGTGKPYKSRVVETEVYRSLAEFDSAEAGDPANSWVQTVLDARDTAVAAARRAEAAAGSSGSGGGALLPDYWEEHLEAQAVKIREAMSEAGWDKSAFLFYSDAHWTYNNKMSPELLKWLHQNTPINKVIFGGDIINTEGEVASTLDYLWEWRAAIRDLEHHCVPGNHDDGNDPDNRWPDSDIYTFLLAAEETPYVVRGDALYYYIDEPAEKTRYIYLDTATKDGNILNDPAEETWLKETLLSTPAGWHIVAAAHIWRIYHGSPATDNGWGMGAKMCLDMFDEYNARAGDFADGKGKVEFCIGGHTHWDADHTSDDGIPVILVETDSKHVRSGLDCTSGTITENSVNAIIADYANGVVNVIRIGRGVSRVVALDGSGSEPEEPDTPVEPEEPEDTSWMTTNATRIAQTSNDTVGIAWSNNVEGVTYVVYEGTTEVARASGTDNVVISGVSAGTHEYKVRPQKSDTNVGYYSNALSITTVADTGWTNVLRTITVDASGSPYNGGLGYKENTRISTSSGYAEVAAAGWDCTGFIPIARGDVVRLRNVEYYDIDDVGGEDKRNCITGYDASDFTSGETALNPLSDAWQPVLDSDGNLAQFTMVSSWQKDEYIRITGKNIDALSIITINEEID